MPVYQYDDLQLMFVRVPKTASSSIMSVLPKPTKRHMLPVHVYSDYKSIAVVRNPIERFASALGMFSKRQGTTFDDAKRLSYGIGDLTASVHFLPMMHEHFMLTSVRAVYRYEELSDKWGEMLDFMGVPEVELPHVKESYDPVVLTDTQVDWIKLRYASDFVTFVY